MATILGVENGGTGVTTATGTGSTVRSDSPAFTGTSIFESSSTDAPIILRNNTAYISMRDLSGNVQAELWATSGTTIRQLTFNTPGITDVAGVGDSWFVFRFGAPSNKWWFGDNGTNAFFNANHPFRFTIGAPNTSNPAHMTLASTGLTLATGVSLIQTANGAVSKPGISATGTWVTGGDTTTTKPYMLIEPTGASSAAWNTAGTGLGVNAPSGFTGYIIEAQTNGAFRFRVDGSGNAYTSSSMNIGPAGLRPNSTYALVLGSSSASNYATASTFLIDMAAATHTAISGNNGGVYIHPTYNQASGTAANTDLKINRTETAIGSGTQLLIDAQVGGVSKFSVNRVGATTLGSMIKATRDAIASPTQGQMVFVTDDGGYLSWYNSGWQKASTATDLLTGSSRVVLVNNSGTLTNNAGTTTENTIFTGTILANSIGINGSFHITSVYSFTNNANVKTIRIKFNGTTVASYALTASNASMSAFTIIRNRGSLTAQVSGPSQSNGNGTFNSGSALAPTTFTFNTAADITVTVTAQSAVGTDVETIEGIEVIANY